MAAHPFGPIENQLIVGYYKRGLGPENRKPCFNGKEMLVPNGQSDPVYHLLKPVFYGWSPANGNSSSHDFEVAHYFTGLSKLDLLSRGLGYRITFTMPSKQIVTNDPTTWPIVDFELLDILGEKVLYKTQIISRKIWGWFPYYLQEFDSLMVENTPLQIKLIQNGVKETILPSFSPNTRVAAEEYAEFARMHYGVADRRNESEFCEYALGNYIGVLRLLVEAIDPLVTDQKLGLRTHLRKMNPILESISLDIERIRKDYDIPVNPIQIERIIQESTVLVAADTPISRIQHLANSLGKLLQPLWRNLLDLNFRTHAEKSLQEHSDRWVYAGAFRLVENIFNEIKDLQQIIKASSNDLHLKTRQTRDFSLEAINSSDSQLYLTSMPSKSYKIKLSSELMHVVPNRNFVIGFPSSKMKFYTEQLELIDLKMTFESFAGSENQIKKIDLPKQNFHSSGENLLGFLVSSNALIMCTRVTSNKWTSLRYLPFNQNEFAEQVPASKWIVIRIQTRDLQPKEAVLHRRVTAKLVFVALMNPANTWNNKSVLSLLQCWQYSEASKTLTLKAETPAAKGQNLLWISKQIYTYACVFTSDRLQELWLCKNFKFSPIRLRNPPTTVPRGVFTNTVEFIWYVSSSSIGVFRCKKVKQLPDGHDCYRVGRLYLKY